MSKQTKTTPWFINGEKPAYKGVYNVSCRKKEQSGEWFAHWDGKYFNYFSRTVENAYDYSTVEQAKFSNEEGSWRGLTEEPTKS